MRWIFESVTVIDGAAEAPLETMDVVVEGERITTVRRHVPAGERSDANPDAGPELRLDGRGLTLLPGLIDAHCHYTFDPDEGDLGIVGRRSDAEIVLAAAGHAARALRAGVTSARGAGSIRGLELALRDAIAAGRIPGPRLVAAGLAVGAVGGHGHAFGLEAKDEPGLRDATGTVARAGADVIKVVASEAAMLTTTGLAPGAMVHGAPELTDVQIAAIVQEARRHGLRVMSHAQDGESVIRSARGGADSVEHAWLADPAALEVLAATGAALVPTLIVTDVNRDLPGLTPIQRERQDHIELRHRASCETAIRLGIPIVAGTDTGEVGVTSDMVWREMALIRDHGASAMDAVRAGTSRAAELLGIDDAVGSVREGAVADLLLVEGDPLEDLRRLGRPALVLQGGRAVGGVMAEWFGD
jgi:imidazolonepropionase-like amidohydrolase